MKHNSSDRAAWARVATMPPFKKLKRAICIMLVFLLTETECERTFAEERTVHSGRPRMDPNTRFECLKVKTDGLPFHELHEDGKPVNNFWRCCQDAYAKRFGTKHLRDVNPRSDRGKHRTNISGMAKTRAPTLKENENECCTEHRRRVPVPA